MAVTNATDSHYDDNLNDWELISRMWTGDDVRSTLVRGAYEAKRAFRKRKKGADFKPYTRDLISRLTGELFTRAGEISRSTVVTDEYLDDVGPKGESYHVQLVNLAEVITAYNEGWIVMDPAQGLRIVEPQFVPRSTESAVVVTGERTTGDSVFEDEKTTEAWTVYYADHYETYVKTPDDEDSEEKRVDAGFYYQEGWSFRDGPPAVRIELPWRVKFGLSVARAHRALYRLESKYDAALTNSLGGLLQIATGGDEDFADKIEEALKEGAIAVEYADEYGEHQPLNVGTEGLGPGENALKRKRNELYRSAYQSLDQASQRMTATEADARNRAGPAAAMSVLGETMESAEKSILPIIAQAEDSRRANETLSPTVDWPTDFTHAFGSDDDELTREIFGSPGLPADVETATDILMGRYEGAGYAPDRDAIRSEVQKARDRAAQSPTDESFVN